MAKPPAQQPTKQPETPDVPYGPPPADIAGATALDAEPVEAEDTRLTVEVQGVFFHLRAALPGMTLALYAEAIDEAQRMGNRPDKADEMLGLMGNIGNLMSKAVVPEERRAFREWMQDADDPVIGPQEMVEVMRKITETISGTPTAPR